MPDDAASTWSYTNYLVGSLVACVSNVVTSRLVDIAIIAERVIIVTPPSQSRTAKRANHATATRLERPARRVTRRVGNVRARMASLAPRATAALEDTSRVAHTSHLASKSPNWRALSMVVLVVPVLVLELRPVEEDEVS
ncbi:hypothetical protein B566_EDAN010620, partial [Ephemera danica]